MSESSPLSKTLSRPLEEPVLPQSPGRFARRWITSGKTVDKLLKRIASISKTMVSKKAVQKRSLSAPLAALAALSCLAISDLAQASNEFPPSTIGVVTVSRETRSLPTTREGSVSFVEGGYNTTTFSSFSVGQAASGALLTGSSTTVEMGYFEFDSDIIPAILTSASLQLFLPLDGLSGSAPTSTQSVEIRATDFNRLSSPGVYPDETPPFFFGDEVFARATVTTAEAGSMIVFHFNQAGLDYLKNAEGLGNPSVKLVTLIVPNNWPDLTPDNPTNNTIGGGVFVNTANLSPSLQPRLIINQIPDPATLDLTVQMNGIHPQINFVPAAGLNHQVQYSETLAPDSWISLPGAPHNTGSINDTEANLPTKRFYRVKLEAPAP